MKKLLEIYRAHREVISYLFFGVCTTAVNFAVFFLFDYAGLDIKASTAIAWAVSVMFAFVTNRQYVFVSSSTSFRMILGEMLTFYLGRAFSLLVDMAIMEVFVTWLAWGKLPVKIMANVVVIVLNYIISKLLVFRKKQ